MLLDTLQGWRLRNPRRLPGTNRQARHLLSASKEKKEPQTYDIVVFVFHPAA